MSTAPQRVTAARSTFADFHLLAMLLVASGFVGTRLVAAYGEITGTFDAVLVGEGGLLSVLVVIVLPVLVLALGSITVAIIRRMRADGTPSMWPLAIIVAASSLLTIATWVISEAARDHYATAALLIAMVGVVLGARWLLSREIPRPVVVLAGVLWWCVVAGVALVIVALMIALSAW